METLKDKEAVNAVKKKTQKWKGNPAGKNKGDNTKQQSYQRQPQRKFEDSTCSRCGSTHKPRNCPAYGQQCRICKRYNHYAKVYKNKKYVNSVTDTKDENDETYTLGKIAINSVK